MYEYDGFYNEPSEFEQKIEEFKQSLLQGVKKDFLDQMEALRKENAELEEVKNNFDQIKRDYRAKERELAIKMSEAKREAYRARLSELLVDHKVLMYRATSRYRTGQKCDKCDDHRRISYKTPLGKDAHEDCGCAKKITYYVPEEMVYASLSIRNGKAAIWYEIKESGDEDYLSRSSDHADKVYKTGTDFKDLPSWYYGTFFESKEECQAYCNWLTAKEGQGDNQ